MFLFFLSFSPVLRLTPETQCFFLFAWNNIILRNLQLCICYLTLYTYISKYIIFFKSD